MVLTREKVKELFKAAVQIDRALDEVSTEDTKELKDCKYHSEGLIYRLARMIDEANGSSKVADSKVDSYLTKAEEALAAAIRLARDRDKAVNGLDLVERVTKRLVND